MSDQYSGEVCADGAPHWFNDDPSDLLIMSLEATMNINDLKPPSSFLKKEDLPRPVKVTIDAWELQEFDDKQKLVLSFKGKEKKLAVNMTNAKTIAACLGSHDTDDWIGKEITIYNDPTVSMGDKIVGGIRVQYVPPAADDDGSEFNDEIPF